MKRIAMLLLSSLVLLLVCTACLASCQESEPPLPEESRPAREEATKPDPPTEPETRTQPEPEQAAPPEEAVAELFESVKEWDVEAINSYLTEGSTIESQVPAGFDSAVAALLGRMEYTVGEATVTGDTAAVEMELTAADAEKALGDAAGSIVAKVALAKLMGREITDYTPFVEEAVNGIDVDALPTVTRSATAYMTKDENGEWKLDAGDERNLPLLDAATGGALNAVKEFGEKAAEYGIKPAQNG